MTTAKTVHAILSASGLTQEKLARKLGVSFATVNSWARGRSEPRSHMREQLAHLHTYYVTGDTVIPATALEEKKRSVYTLRTKHPGIVHILTRPDVRAQMLLSLTYNTNRIEGSTFTEADTAAVLFENATLPRKSLTEHLEAKNHQIVLEQLFEQAKAGALPAIDETYVLALHGALMHTILPDAGTYRTHGVRIVGTYVPTANWQRVPVLMQTLLKDMCTTVEQKDPIAHLARTHAQFEQIHPFADGNGRIGRILMHAIALRHDLPPVLVEHARKRVYYACLAKAQLEADHVMLESFLCDAFLASYALCFPDGT